MLEIMRRGQRWLLWVVIVLVGGTFAVTFGIGGSFNPSRPDEVLVEVDGRRYDGRDLQRVRQNLEAEYRRVLGDNYDAEAAGAFLDQSAADILVSQAIFARWRTRPRLETNTGLSRPRSRLPPVAYMKKLTLRW